MKNKSNNLFELRFHHAIPGWCKIKGLQIKEIPLCEGGGFMILEPQARVIVDALNKSGVPDD